MKNFGIGLSLGLLGAILWFGTSVIIGIVKGFGGESIPIADTFKYLGFTIMVGGPVVYWIICPVVELIKRRRK